MPKWHPKKCRVCGKPATKDEPISQTGLCHEHGLERLLTNNAQISAHKGEFFDHWRRRTLAAFGGVPVDELTRDR